MYDENTLKEIIKDLQRRIERLEKIVAELSNRT